jgi:DNA-directed RNA polymerase sigma subunit (sigma70/sigma32)
MGLGELVADTRVGTPDDRAFQREELDVLRRLLDTIDDREATILRLRFGLDGREPLTLKQIADQIGISRERVRQIVDEALSRLNERLSDAKPSRFFRRDADEFEATDSPSRPGDNGRGNGGQPPLKFRPAVTG